MVAHRLITGDVGYLGYRSSLQVPITCIAEHEFEARVGAQVK